ncbi:hypothetical protein SNE40_008015 [Patella caerulea]|uniref:Uncharacterized protein n=1 Tax=Patella caerulea TaxID=87958 RepID=A0AAN8K0A9_PATCE
MKLMVVLMCMTAIPVNSLQNIGWIWHVTDFHYDFSYWSDQFSCNNEVTSPGIYGDYWCDSPWLLIKDSIESMKEIRPDVDFLIWTGDNIGHIHDEHLSIDQNMDTFRNITNELKRQFPNIPTYATLGNHDYYPSDQFSPNTSEIYQRIGEMWKDWINDTEQVEQFKNGGFYSVKTKYGLRILGLNTNLYYTSNKVTTNLTDPAGQFAWLDQQLTTAKTNNEKVIITAHIPPGIHTPSNVLWFRSNFNERFLNIIKSHVNDDTIKVAYYGHNHADGFKIVYKTDGTPAFPVFNGPSVTPWRYKIPVATGPPHNPGIRLISYDRTTGQPINILTYYINLPESNANNKTDWKLEYNFTHAYGIDDVTAPSIHKLTERMVKDRSLVDMYYKYKDVSVTNSPACDDNCRNSILCGFSKSKMDEFNSCKDSYTGSANTVLKPAPVIITTSMCLMYFMHMK